MYTRLASSSQPLRSPPRQHHRSSPESFSYQASAGAFASYGVAAPLHRPVSHAVEQRPHPRREVYYAPQHPKAPGSATAFTAPLREATPPVVYTAPHIAPPVAMTPAIRQPSPPQYLQPSYQDHQATHDDDLQRHVRSLEDKLDRVLALQTAHSQANVSAAYTSYLPAASSMSTSSYGHNSATYPAAYPRFTSPAVTYLPDPIAVAKSLYSFDARALRPAAPLMYETAPTAHVSQGRTLRSISPPRHHVALPPVTDLPVVQVPPPPVLPGYVPARSHMDAVERSYASIALRHLLQDIEDDERRERMHIMESQLLAAAPFAQKREALLALLQEEAKLERLAALDAEALLRHHLSKVVRGETHRDRVVEDLTATHQQREQSPEGRRSRYLLEVSRSPVRASRQPQAASPSDGHQMRKPRGSVLDDVSPIVVPAAHSPYAPSPAAAAVMQSSRVNRTTQNVTFATGDTSVHGSRQASAEYNSARRRYKKALMEQALQ